MTDTSLVTRIEELYTIAIQEKNSWGKNEVIALFKDCINKALKERIEKLEEEKLNR